MTYWTTEDLALNYKLGKESKVGVRGYVGYGHSASSRADFTSVNLWDFNYGLTSQLALPWHMQLVSDLTLYWDGKALRDTKRGEQASHEADYSAEMMYEIFSEATGTTISAEKTPAISKLIGYVLDKCSVTADRLKEIRFRKRPFVQLGEPSFVPGDEEKERGKSSFPSGHTNLGLTEALVMTELAPDHQNEILKCGYEYGYNRQIVGYHWFTDVIATRQLASALYAYLHSDAEFQKLMQEARKEYQSMTASAIRTVTPDDNDSRRAAIYTLDGRRVYGKPARKGIYISDGKEVVN
jgi:acid phosphatase (class A)